MFPMLELTQPMQQIYVLHRFCGLFMSLRTVPRAHCCVIRYIGDTYDEGNQGDHSTDMSVTCWRDCRANSR